MGKVGYCFQGKEVPASPGDVWQPPLSPGVGEVVIPAGEASYVRPWEVQHGQIIHMYNPWEAGLGGKKHSGVSKLTTVPVRTVVLQEKDGKHGEGSWSSELRTKPGRNGK